jgi:hypothetical protein
MSGDGRVCLRLNRERARWWIEDGIISWSRGKHMITSITEPVRRLHKTNGDGERPAARRRGQPLRGLDVLRKYVAEHGWERVTRRTLADGFHLGHWVSVRRTDYKRGILSDYLIRELEAIPGWTWDPIETRYRKYLDLLRKFVEQNGIDRFNARTIVDGVRLGAWATCRRVDYREGKLPDWLKQELERIPGWTWSIKNDFHGRALELTKAFVTAHGWQQFRSRTVSEGVAIGAWVTRRRSDYRNGRLPHWLQRELEAIPGWEWSAGPSRKRLETAGPVETSTSREAAALTA